MKTLSLGVICDAVIITGKVPKSPGGKSMLTGCPEILGVGLKFLTRERPGSMSETEVTENLQQSRPPGKHSLEGKSDFRSSQTSKPLP